MKTKTYAESEYRILTHNRFKCFYTLVKQGEHYEAHNVSVPSLAYTKFSSTKLTERSARILGEILIEIADTLKHE